MLNYTESTKEYVQNVVNRLDKKIKSNKIWFNIINVSIILVALGGGVITPIIMSKMLINKYPEWFFYATAGLAAAAGLLMGVLNFFMLKENIKTYERNRVFVQQELIKYNDKLSKKYQTKDAEFYLFTSVASICGSKAAREEDGRE